MELERGRGSSEWVIVSYSLIVFPLRCPSMLTNALLLTSISAYGSGVVFTASATDPTSFDATVLTGFTLNTTASTGPIGVSGVFNRLLLILFCTA